MSNHRILVIAGAAALLGACIDDTPTTTLQRPNYAFVQTTAPVNVSRDTTAQNETPLAVNPRNPLNLLTGNNDWNYNDGCGVNVSFDGGRTWTPTLPNGFVPGITKYTNDPAVPGTGIYDYAGDPAVAFAPDGTAYFACFGYQATPPYGVALLLNRSTDGGLTWQQTGLTLVSAFTGKGQARGSTGQFPDHDAMTVAPDGTIYVTWAQFTGYSSHSPIYVATSTDGGHSFSTPIQVGSRSVLSDQDARVAIDPRTGYAYLTFDNSVLGGKGTAMFVSVSTDRGATWSLPTRFATFVNPVCLYPPYCFNISGGQFRGPGSYPVPAVDPVHNRLYVAYSDIVNGLARIYLTSASLADLGTWTTPREVAPGTGDRINVEMSIDQTSGRIDIMTNDRSYTNNARFDITYAGSLDGGLTWTSARITRTSWDPSQYGVPSGTGIRPFIGDYDGIVSFPDGAGMTWTGPGPTVGTIPDNLDVFFARVVF